MGITMRKEAQARIVLDKAAFIEMEVEHSNDTAGVITRANQKTINLDSVQQFSDAQQHKYRDLRLEAYANGKQ